MKYIWKIIKGILFYTTKAGLLCVFAFGVVVQISWDIIWHLKRPTKGYMMQWYRFLRTLPKLLDEIIAELTSSSYGK